MYNPLFGGGVKGAKKVKNGQKWPKLIFQEWLVVLSCLITHFNQNNHILGSFSYNTYTIGHRKCPKLPYLCQNRLKKKGKIQYPKNSWSYEAGRPLILIKIIMFRVAFHTKHLHLGTGKCPPKIPFSCQNGFKRV